MINGITNLWNFLTNSSVVLYQNYVEYFFSLIDIKKQGKVSEDL